jgi:hypothetical protein
MNTAVPDATAPARGDLRRVLLFGFVYALALWFALLPSGVTDPDIGWHLRTGEWILSHRMVPATDPFSQIGAMRPWVAYSWLFDLLLVVLVRTFGLAGVLIYTAVFTVAILMTLHLLLARCGAGVIRTLLLLAATVIATAPMLTPRSWLVTILCFLIAWNLIDGAERTGNRQRLIWLLPLFVVWANVHVQFVYGLMLVGLYAVAPLASPWLERRPDGGPRRESGRWSLLGGCVLATLVTPFGYRLYGTVVELARDTGAFHYITELQAMTFQNPAHWATLALTIGAAFAIGRHRRVGALPLLLFPVAIVLGYRSARDAWLVVFAADSILALPSSASGHEPSFPLRPRFVTGLLLVAAAASVLIWMRFGISGAALEAQLARTYPADAVAYVEQHQYAGPLYNHFNWGGYLIWRLPRLPVSMDGRSNIYGDDRINHAAAIWDGTGDWSHDPELAASRLVIADVHRPLTTLLARDDRFRIVYEDAVAAVFVRRSAEDVARP